MEKFKLTYPQRNIWLVENFYNSDQINIISGALEIKKDFDASIAKRAVNKFVELNDAMRTRIVVENSEPMQYIVPYQAFDCDVIDAKGMSVGEIQKIKEEYIRNPFDIINNQLFSYILIDKGNGSGEIFLKAHHLICDGWSASKMVTAIASIYDELLNGEDNYEKFPSYVDYINKEKEYELSDKFKIDEEFWKDYLKGFSEPVGIRQNPNNLTKAKRYSVKLNDKLNTVILDFCKTNKVSPYSVFMTALAIYLHRITEKIDIVIGTPILNRSNFNEKRMQGMFVSTMPVRFRIDEQDTFISICKNTAKESMSLFRHQRFPYSLTAENAKKENSISDNLYRVMLSYQNARASFAKEDTYEMSWTFSGENQDELSIHVVDLNDDGILEVDYDYVEDIFELGEMEYIAKRIETIIYDGIVNNKTVANIEIMPEKEKNKILKDFNNTTREYPKNRTVIDIFEEQVEKTTDNVALKFEGKTLTYKELNNKANSLANTLIEKGVKVGECVALKLNRTEKILIAILAILKTGASYLPIDISLPQDRINYMVENSNTSFSIEDRDLQFVDAEFHNLNKYIDLSNPFYILYTSGTTGLPKGATITHKNMLNFYEHFKLINEFNNIDTIISITTISFDIFVFEAFIPLLFGKTVIMTNEEEQKNSLKILELIEKNNVDMIQTTPSRMQLIIDGIRDITRFKGLKEVVLAGEKLPYDLKNKFADLGIQVCNGYGPTETTIFSSYTDVTNLKKITIGKPLLNTKFLIRDSKMRLLPLGITGELYIAGDGISDGYINNQELTQKAYLDIDGEKEYRTGDFAKINFELQTICEGRRDSQVKIHGLRIELDEIEIKIRAINGIGNVAVVIHGDKDKKILAFVTKKDVSLTERDIKEALQKVLPKYMIPSKIIFKDKIPYTSNGKVNKKELLGELDTLNIYESYSRQEVGSEEKALIDKVEALTGKRLRVDESFFEAGIDSFDIIRLSVALSTKYNKEIQVKELIDCENIRELLCIIKEKPDLKREEFKNLDMARLSKNQESIFYNYIKDPDSTLYNTPCEIVFDKKVDTNRLRQTVESVVNFHQAFNSNIKIESGIYYLKFNKFQKIEVDIKILAQAEYEKIKSEFVRPFDLISDTLCRVVIIETENNIYLLFDSHHIIFDGSSIEIVLKEMCSVYNGEETLQKTDGYINWLSANNNSSSEEDIKYFANKVESSSPTMFQPDFKSGEKKNRFGKRINSRMSKELFDKISEYSKKQGVTNNVVCLGALELVLAKYNYIDTCSLGIATTHREHTNSDMVGMFVNTLPYIHHIEKTDSVNNYLLSIKNEVKDTLKHNSCTTEEICKYIGENRPLYSIVYTYQNFVNRLNSIGNVNAKFSYLYNNISKFDITFELQPHQYGLDVSIEYDSNMYSYEKIDALLNHYIKCLEELIEKETLTDIDILEDVEKNKINKFNTCQKRIESVDSIQSIFENVVKANYLKNALVHNGEKITFGKLDELSNNVSANLLSAGVKHSDVIAVAMDKNINLIVSILGIVKAGATYLPIDISIPSERIKYMLTNSQTKYILCDRKSADNINLNHNIEKLIIEDLISTTELVKNSNHSPKDTCYIMYTSGSTGIPKGVTIRQEGIIRLVTNTNYIEPQDTDSVALSGTMSFDASVFEMWLALLNGLTLHIIDKSLLLNQEAFEAYINENSVTIMLLTTALFDSFANYSPSMFENVRYLITGGDVFSYKSGNSILNATEHTQIINAYGPTESTVITSVYKYNKEMWTDVPIGRPINDTNCYIVDIFGKQVPICGKGELLIGGSGVASGYVNNEQETNKRFINTEYEQEKVYSSGDIVELNNDLNMVFKHRKDNQIKLNGYRIEISEIITKLLEIDGITQAEVLFNKNKNNELIAYLVSNGRILADDVKSYLKNTVPSYMIPKEIVFIEKMPLTLQGKVDRRKLAKIEIFNSRKIEMPVTEEEKTLYNIWKNLLNTTNFGITDDFFELGGDSITAIQFVMECSKVNLNYTYNDLYDYRTIKQLVLSSESLLSKKYATDIFDYNILNENINKYEYRLPQKNSNLLITGATGFLGAHVLDEYMKTQSGVAYCIVRDKEVDAKTRLKNKLNFFFGDKYDNCIDNRIVVLSGDLTQNKFGLDDDKYEQIAKNVDAVINCAAFVKHYGDIEKFKKINVDTVQNLIEFCIANSKELYHISTLSVCGNMLEGGQVEQDMTESKMFTERDLYFGQKLYNAYVYSKFLAECNIISSLTRGLKATILRTGNLTGRYSDGKFQPNVGENAFANRVKAFAYMKCIPESMQRFNLEFTPIDYASVAVNKIVFANKEKPLIAHVYNDNYTTMHQASIALKKNGIEISPIRVDEFTKRLKSNMDQNSKEIQGIVIDIGKNDKISYESNIIVSAKSTKKYLESLKFEWPNIDAEYLYKYFEYLINIGFLKNGGKKDD